MNEKDAMTALTSDIITVCSVVGVVDKSLEDGKIDLIEAVGIAAKSIGLVKVARNYKDSLNTLTSLSTDEKNDLIQSVEKEFDLRNDKAERIVESIIQVIISLVVALKAQAA